MTTRLIAHLPPAHADHDGAHRDDGQPTAPTEAGTPTRSRRGAGGAARLGRGPRDPCGAGRRARRRRRRARRSRRRRRGRPGASPGGGAAERTSAAAISRAGVSGERWRSSAAARRDPGARRSWCRPGAPDAPSGAPRVVVSPPPRAASDDGARPGAARSTQGPASEDGSGAPASSTAPTASTSSPNHAGTGMLRTGPPVFGGAAGSGVARGGDHDDAPVDRVADGRAQRPEGGRVRRVGDLGGRAAGRQGEGEHPDARGVRGVAGRRGRGS